MNAYLTPPVIWLSLGVLMLILEVVTGGFWIGFFGVGALLTSLAIWLGMVGQVDFQIAIFLASSVLFLFILRRPLTHWLNRKSSPATFDDTGHFAVVVQEIPSHGIGRVSYQGSTWDAESERGKAIPPNTRVRIVRQDGIRPYVRSEHASP